MTYSFIDMGLQDFLRDLSGKTIRLKVASITEAEDWLLKHGKRYGWTNTGVRYWCWEDES